MKCPECNADRRPHEDSCPIARRHHEAALADARFFIENPEATECCRDLLPGDIMRADLRGVQGSDQVLVTKLKDRMVERKGLGVLLLPKGLSTDYARDFVNNGEVPR